MGELDQQANPSSASSSSTSTGTHSAQREKSPFEKFLHWMAFLFGIGGLIVIATFKNAYPEWKTGWLVLSVVGVIALGTALYFAFAIRDWWKHRHDVNERTRRTELPEPISRDDALNRLRNELFERYDNYVDKVLKEGVEEHGEVPQKICYIHATPVWKDDYPEFFVALNMHYPETNVVFIPKQEEMDDAAMNYAMSSAKRRLVTKPEPEKDFEERMETDLSGGRQVVYRKSIATKPMHIEEKKEDLK